MMRAASGRKIHQVRAAGTESFTLFLFEKNDTDLPKSKIHAAFAVIVGPLAIARCYQSSV